MRDNRYPCDVCHVGSRQERQATYALLVGERLVMIPNVTVWVCDVCGDVLYETDSIERMEMLLGLDRTLVDPLDPEDLPSGRVEDYLSTLNSRRRSV